MMSICYEIKHRLKQAGIRFASVREKEYEGQDAVEVVRQDGLTKMNYTITIDSEKDPEYIANVVVSYITNGRNNWQR